MKDTQLLAWALDRAIEALKLDKSGNHTPEDVMKAAGDMVDWIVSRTPPEELPEANAEAPSEVQ